MMALAIMPACADTKTVCSPDGRMQMTIELTDGKACYSVSYDNRPMMERSALGLTTNRGDFTSGLLLKGYEEKQIDQIYRLHNGKASDIHFLANYLAVNLTNAQGLPMTI